MKHFQDLLVGYRGHTMTPGYTTFNYKLTFFLGAGAAFAAGLAFATGFFTGAFLAAALALAGAVVPVTAWLDE